MGVCSRVKIYVVCVCVCPSTQTHTHTCTHTTHTHTLSHTLTYTYTHSNAQTCVGGQQHPFSFWSLDTLTYESCLWTHSMCEPRLSNNKITALPDGIASLSSLELIRVANNRLTTVPPSILTLDKLAWVALAGNPGLTPPKPRTSLAAVTLDDIDLFEKLGEVRVSRQCSCMGAGDGTVRLP